LHTIALLRSEMFDVIVDGKRSFIDEVMPGWHLHDRLGLVIDEPLGGLGASHLVQIAITSFYDAQERRRGELSVYPEIYAFHLGRGHGSHAAFDFWPARREVILSDDPCDLLDAINDRGITRLVVPDREARPLDFRPKEVDTALDRIHSAFAYHPSGRTQKSDIDIRGNDPRTEVNPGRVLRPVYLDKPAQLAKPFKESDSAYIRWLKLRESDLTASQREDAIRRRDEIRDNGLVTETYRRIPVLEALGKIAGQAARGTDETAR
jgi:hypothetical protein